MNLGRKGGNTSRLEFVRNKLSGMIESVHDVFSLNSNETHEIEPFRYDENARKTVEAAQLNAELGKAEAQKILQKVV